MSDPSPALEGAFLPHGSPAKPNRVPPQEDPPAPSVVDAAPVLLKRAPSPSGGYFVTALIAAGVSGVIATIVAVVVSLGIGFFVAGPPGGRGDRIMQEGKVIVGPNGPREVFYAEPFAGPPKLELESNNMFFITLKEQKADHFTVEAKVNSEVHWRAEGMREKK